MMTVRFNAREFNRTLDRYAVAAGRDLNKLIDRVAKQTVRDFVTLTPPKRKGAGVFKQGLKEQEKIGKDRVAAEVKATHQGADETGLWNSPERKILRSFRRAVRAGDKETVAAMLGGNVTVLDVASEAHHDKQRDNRGRVRQRVDRAVILKPETIKGLIKTKQDKVMFAKAGWMTPARALKVTGLTKAVKKHAAPGAYFDLSKKLNPKHRVVNLVDYAQGWFSDIIPVVLRHRQRMLLAELRQYLKKQAAKFRKR